MVFGVKLTLKMLSNVIQGCDASSGGRVYVIPLFDHHFGCKFNVLFTKNTWLTVSSS